ncbi:hypothetical protein DFH06DRAFT_1333872 [Mycena polygramma]|nr:hypothetical protein DFH06DRAFT_1333872 [Mycena polygramma]
MAREKVKHQFHGFNDSSDEAAGAKIWSVYISEAAKYDKALVDNWKSDMKGILIFAGLFSASLTAFIIESCRTLTPDKGQLTITLLAQISQQLAVGTNGTLHDSPNLITAAFRPPLVSVICNSLWFISLAFSLSAALVATLVEQWARNFVHKSEIRPSPVVRARVLAYLYYGLQRFHMRTIVEAVPILLHTSLFLFFSGLVAFLLPINTVIALIIAGVLGTVAAGYSCLTVLPVLYPDCPFWTPISGVLWMAMNVATRATPKSKPEDAESSSFPGANPSSTMTESIISHATVDCPARLDRDARALCWTAKSLVDDDELESLLEGIPDLIHDSQFQRRFVWDGIVRHLLNDPDVALGSRMLSMIPASDSGLVAQAPQARRLTSCLKAIWAVAVLADMSPSSLQGLWQPFRSFQESSLSSEFIRQSPSVQHYSVSAFALGRWASSRFRSRWIEDGIQLLNSCEAHIRGNTVADLNSVANHLKKMQPERSYPTNLQNSPDHGSSWIAEKIRQLQQMKDEFKNEPLDTCLQFLEACSSLFEPPYQFEETWRMLEADISGPMDPGYVLRFEEVFRRIKGMDSCAYERTSPAPDPVIRYSDDLLGAVFPLWQRITYGYPPPVAHLSESGRMRSYSRFADPVQHPPGTHISEPVMLLVVNHLLSTETTSTSLMWTWAWLDLAALAAVATVASSPISISARALLQYNILYSRTLVPCDDDHSGIAYCGHSDEDWSPLPLFPAETAAPENYGLYHFEQRLNEGWLVNIAQFLEHCSSQSQPLPYKSRATLSVIAAFQPGAPIHVTHQRRFAQTMHNLISAGDTTRLDLVGELVVSKMFSVYTQSPEDAEAQPDQASAFKYLDDPTAVRAVIDALQWATVFPFPTLATFSHFILITKELPMELANSAVSYRGANVLTAIEFPRGP